MEIAALCVVSCGVHCRDGIVVRDTIAAAPMIMEKECLYHGIIYDKLLLNHLQT